MSYFTRLRGDPLLDIVKDDPAPAALVGDNTMAKQRADQKRADRADAARRAWEVRRARFGPGGGNKKGYGKAQAPVPQQANKAPEQPRAGRNTDQINQELRASMDSLQRKLAEAAPHGDVLDRLPWAKTRPKGRGINRSGFIDVDGKRYFGKVQQEIESDIELGVWNFAQKLGWEDMARPTAKEQIEVVRDGEKKTRGFTIQPLLPEGDVIANIGRGRKIMNMPIDKGHRMILFDYAIGGGDRHEENFWVDKKGEVYGIDYARSFQKYPHPRNTLANYGAIKDWNPPRAMVELVVANQKSIIDSIPAKGGFETSHKDAVLGVQKRMEKLRSELLKQKGDNIDLSFLKAVL